MKKFDGYVVRSTLTPYDLIKLCFSTEVELKKTYLPNKIEIQL